MMDQNKREFVPLPPEVPVARAPRGRPDLGLPVRRVVLAASRTRGIASMMTRKKPTYSPRVRAQWLKKRRWPFQISVICPTGSWRISAGIYDTFGEGPTFEAAVDDAITNERLRKRGCCSVAAPVVTQIPETKSRQMLRAMDAMRKVLTDGDYRRCAR